jgi:hypothetical protein
MAAFNYFCKRALLLHCLNKAVLEKGRRHIIYTWIVLICFVAGQAMVSAHQHLVKSNTHETAQNQQTVSEKCQLCDVMHHNSMTIADNHYSGALVASDYFYTPGIYAFVSVALILSSGRAPPLS